MNKYFTFFLFFFLNPFFFVNGQELIRDTPSDFPNNKNLPDNKSAVFSLTNNGSIITIDQTLLFVSNALRNTSTGKFTIKSGGAAVITDHVTNDGDHTNFIVQDSGNLIQNDNTSTNQGNITVENLFTFTDNRKQYNYIISPVKGQNLKTIYPGNPIVLYHYENANYFYYSSGDYIAGRGLAVKESPIGDNSQTAKYIGIPFNGILDYPLAYTTDKANVTHGWNLIGNPYPSNLDLLALYNNAGNSSKISSTFMFWDNKGNTLYSQQGSAYQGANYAKFNVASGSEGTGTAINGNASKIPYRYVKTGVGFMVQAKEDANGKALHFENQYRANNYATDFHGKNTNPDDRFWLLLHTPSGVERTAAVVYFPGGNDAYAEDDSEADSLSDDLYTLLGEHKLSIQGKAPFNNSDVLPLGINTYTQGNYTISLLKKEGVFEQGQEIYLKDKKTGILTDLSIEGYQFFVDAGTTENRFEIVYKTNSTLGTQNLAKQTVEVYRDGGYFVVRSNEKIENLEVYDMSGRLVFAGKPKTNEYRISADHFNSGIYLLKIQLPSGVQVKKIRK